MTSRNRASRSQAFVLLQHLTPKTLLSRILGRLAMLRAGCLTRFAVKQFIAHYQVDMTAAELESPEAFATFNAFFTRRLKAGSRPLAAARLVCPVDGTISQLGRIQEGRIFQAKGHDFSACELLGGDASLATAFAHGQFATIYLSPRDYHRVHMPCDGEVLSMTHVPGRLYSVNPATVAGVAGLFARNERVICRIRTSRGEMAVVLVGAAIVGSIATTWHGRVRPQKRHELSHWDYQKQPIALRQGDELGWFELGSTVIMLLPNDAPPLERDLAAGSTVRVGVALTR